MLIDSHHEVYVFASAFLCGQVVCIIFDVFRAFRKNISPSIHTVNIQDLLFGILTLFIIYGTLTYVNDAIVRWYEIASLFISGAVYFLFESRFVLKMFTIIFSRIIRPVVIMKSKLYIAVNVLKIRLFCPFFAKFTGFSKKCIKKIRKFIKNHK